MTKSDFGGQLRILRQQCSDPTTGKQLSQQRMGELMQEEMGIRYSGAAVSDWERGESVINANDRLLLIGLIKVLKRCGGIEISSDANALLEAGNYRSLNAVETAAVLFEKAEAVPPNQTHIPAFILNSFLFNLYREFSSLVDKAKESPPPVWPRIAALVTRKVTDQVTAMQVLRAAFWLWICGIAYFLLTPSLQLASISNINPFQIVILYAIGSMILPLLVGVMTSTKDNPLWKEQKSIGIFTLRLYTHQGAYVGFHIGYFLVFLFTSVQNLFGFPFIAWLELIKAAIPITIAYAAAQLVPHNLWLAYRRLDLRDGGIFFIFVILGPAWAWFFLNIYEIFISPIIGSSVVLAAVTLLVLGKSVRMRKL